MKIGFVGARQAGCVGLLTVLATGLRVPVVIAQDRLVREIAQTFGCDTHPTVHALDWTGYDLLVNVHGREYIPASILAVCPAINVHPCLSQYPGRDPIGRLLADNGTKASVGVHRMTATIDQGELLAESFVDVQGLNTREAIYNKIYPLYVTTLMEALGRLGVVLT
jgi:methionyl-tRNA formyltransferase